MRGNLRDLYGGIETDPSKWNEKSGNLLAQMVLEIEKCSRGMAAARAVWPKNIKVTWSYLVTVVYEIIKGEIKLRKGYVNTACLNQGVDVFNTEIQYELTK